MFAGWLTLLNSRFRLDSSDHYAAEITGHPNGLIRALLKIAIGIADHIKKQEHTSWQLESLNIVAPVSHRQICVWEALQDICPGNHS